VVQRSPTDCGVSECDLETSQRRRPRPDLGWAVAQQERKNVLDIKCVYSSLRRLFEKFSTPTYICRIIVEMHAEYACRSSCHVFVKRVTFNDNLKR
jgi:hypothetical protein